MSGRRLAVQRKILGMTQEEAAKKIGISRSTLSNHELSYIKQTMNEVTKLAALCRENK